MVSALYNLDLLPRIGSILISSILTQETSSCNEFTSYVIPAFCSVSSLRELGDTLISFLLSLGSLVLRFSLNALHGFVTSSHTSLELLWSAKLGGVTLLMYKCSFAILRLVARRILCEWVGL